MYQPNREVDGKGYSPRHSFPSTFSPKTLWQERYQPNQKVDIRDLQWEDKERVLRLLFAKINQTQTHATPKQSQVLRVQGSGFRVHG